MLGPLPHRASFFGVSRFFLLAFVVSLSITSARAQASGSTLYTKNYTLCLDTYLNISSVNRHYDANSGTFNFTVVGVSPLAVQNVTDRTISTSYTTVRVAFWNAFNDYTVFCNSVTTGCPITANQTITINKAVQIPFSALPLGDIQTNFRVNTSLGQNYTCIDIAPVGYQNPIWREIFIWTPLGIAVFAGLVSAISTLISGPSSLQQDLFVLTSNYALEPISLRLKTPGFFDVIFHAQFIVASGQLSLRYPMFYPLFVSDFAWSSLLFPGAYLDNIAASWYTTNSSSSATPASTSSYSLADVPGLSLNRRFLSHIWRRQATTSSGLPLPIDLNNDPAVVVNITGTGMVNFANAVGLDARALFMSVLVYFLIIAAGILILSLAFLLTVEYLGCWYPSRFGGQRDKIVNFTIGVSLRNLILFYLPLMTYSLYQLMLPAPWYILLVAAMVLVFPLLVVPAYIAFYLLRQRPPTIIFDDILLLLKYGPLYNTFTDESFQFFIVILVHKLFLGIMVSLFQFSGISQAVVIIFLEVLLFLALYLKRPYADEAINILYLFFDAMRIIVSVLNLLYVEQVGLSDDVKQYIAYAQVFLHCVAFLVFLAIPAKNLVAMCMGITSEESAIEVQRRRRQGSLRGNSIGRPLATNSQKEVWRRSGSGSGASNIVLAGAGGGGYGGLNTSGMSTNGLWGVSGVSGDEDVYYSKDRRDSLGAEDMIAWNAAGASTADGRPVSGYDDYAVTTQAMQNVPTNAPGPVRRTSLNDNLNRTQSVGGFGGTGGTGGFYRHSRRSVRRMSKTLDDLAAQAGAVAAYQAGASQNAYVDGQIGGASGYFNDSNAQPRRPELDVELQQLAPPSRMCSVCGALPSECGCDHTTSSSSAPMISTRQKSLGRRTSPGPNIVHLSRSGTNSSNGSDADLGSGSVTNRRSGTTTPLSPEEAFAMTTSGALFQSRGGSEVGSEAMGSQGKSGGKDSPASSFPSRRF